jgi:hypothetical protein
MRNLLIYCIRLDNLLIDNQGRKNSDPKLQDQRINVKFDFIHNGVENENISKILLQEHLLSMSPY